MSRIAIITPTLTKRYDWVKLQDRYYEYCEIPRYYAPDDQRNAFDAVRKVLPGIKEKYIVFAGDDDFHVPAKLEELADWLDRSGEAIVGAHGEALLVQCEDWELDWTVDYTPSMDIERLFSLMRTEVFRAAMGTVPSGPWASRGILENQAACFNEALSRSGHFLSFPGLQFIHCVHSQREVEDRRESVLRRLAEHYGGGWLASWLPSRACSRRNLERVRARHHQTFQHFKSIVNEYCDYERDECNAHGYG